MPASRHLASSLPTRRRRWSAADAPAAQGRWTTSGFAAIEKLHRTQNRSASLNPVPIGRGAPADAGCGREGLSVVTQVARRAPGLAPDLRLADRDPDQRRAHGVAAVAQRIDRGPTQQVGADRDEVPRQAVAGLGAGRARQQLPLAQCQPLQACGPVVARDVAHRPGRPGWRPADRAARSPSGWWRARTWRRRRLRAPGRRRRPRGSLP